MTFSGATNGRFEVKEMATFGSAHAHPFAGVLDSSAGCGVSKVQLKDSRSTEPSTAFNPPGTLTVKRVANGNGALRTNSTLAEPIHRHSPGSAGLSVAGGGNDCCSSTEPRATTGREKVMVGRASAPTTACGRAATTVRPAAGTASGATVIAGGAGRGSRG